MIQERGPAPLVGGVTLLERAINYTRGSLHAVTPEALSHPTPCRDWDLRRLLRHMSDSLVALQEAIGLGKVDLDVADDTDASADPVAAVRDRACLLLGAWAGADGPGPVSIGGCPLTAGVVASTGAIEIAVHGWDVARACGPPRPIPSALAEELLQLSSLLITDVDRPARFAAPADVPSHAGPGDRLIAFLGRYP